MLEAQGHAVGGDEKACAVALDRAERALSYGTLWFNLRPSNTEPVLRLNVEGPDTAAADRLRDEVLAHVRGTAG